MSYVRTELDGSVAILTLDDHARRNALSLELCTELSAAMDDVEADPQVGRSSSPAPRPRSARERT